MYIANQEDTIAALSTAQGLAALAVIRISGNKAIEIANAYFSKDISSAKPYSLHYGSIINHQEVIDDVMLSVFRAPRSFTGEDIVEITCHGSPYIQAEILRILGSAGCRMAEPGEFSMRAFANRKVDLSQAEAIADLISSSSKRAHDLAMNQMRGRFSKHINLLRDRLIHFASMIELELDFSEEDVAFADRKELEKLILEIRQNTSSLMASFAAGNAVKNGIPVAIIGAPNMGKSTLLNALLEEDRAIVSEIAGTTRDTIEDETVIDGMRFRFIDTAGIRETEDRIETLGIARTFEQAGKSSIVLYLIDALESEVESIAPAIEQIREKIGQDQHLILIANKSDKARDPEELEKKFQSIPEAIILSAAEGTGMEDLISRLKVLGASITGEGSEVVVTNARHYEALRKTDLALESALNGLNMGITGDFLAVDIRKALYHLGEITGEITTDDLLGNIFSKFCIGK